MKVSWDDWLFPTVSGKILHSCSSHHQPARLFIGFVPLSMQVFIGKSIDKWFIFQQAMFDYQMVNLHFPMAFPMIFPFSYVFFLWFSIFLWLFLWFSNFPVAFPMIFPFSYGFSYVFPPFPKRPLHVPVPTVPAAPSENFDPHRLVALHQPSQQALHLGRPKVVGGLQGISGNKSYG